MKSEGAPARGLHQVGDMIPPGNLAGANHPGGKKEDALHAMGAQDGIGDGVVVQVPIVEGDQHAAAGGLFFESAVDEGQRLFQSDRRNTALQIGNLVAELFRGRREDAWVEEIVMGVADAMIVQNQKRIPRSQLREQEGYAAPQQAARQQLPFSSKARPTCHNDSIIAGCLWPIWRRSFVASRSLVKGWNPAALRTGIPPHLPLNSVSCLCHFLPAGIPPRVRQNVPPITFIKGEHHGT